MTTIRVTERTRATLRALASERGTPMHEIADKAVELYRRQQVLEATNAAYAALQSNPASFRELAQEQAEWDGTLLDGIEDDY